MSSKSIGLVLSGGGARAAYQSGVIRGVGEICKKANIKYPFDIITGTSAGSINAVYMASHANDFWAAAKSLDDLWQSLHTSDIFKNDPISLSRIAFRWIFQLGLGSFFKKKTAFFLLDASPLKKLIKHHSSFAQLQTNIKDGTLKSLAISCVNYTTGWSETFCQGNDIKEWRRTRRIGIKSKINLKHIMASAAIPVLFPPVRIGQDFYGDGSLRNFTPLSPAIRLGAEKLFVIGVRQRDHGASEPQEHSDKPNLARIFSTVLNAVLLDAIDFDYERLSRINNTVTNLKEDSKSPLKKVDIMMVRPTQDLGLVATEESHHMPKTIQHVLRGMGSIKEGSDLMSYILFEPAFTKRISDLGYMDAMDKKDEITEFLRS